MLRVREAFAVSVSIGVASGPPGAELEVLLAAADTALYRAKRDGRNRVQVAEEEPLPPEQDRRRPAVWPAPAVRQSSVMWPV
jgi:predicted signal transduction protein with EAL and GGDEF domain